MADVIRSSFSPVHIPCHVSLPDFILGRLYTQRHHRLALVDGITGTRLSVSQFVCAIRKCANALCRDGLRHGHVACVILPNCVEYPVLVLGALLAGATVTTLNPQDTQGDILFRLKDCNPRFIFTTPGGALKVKGALKERPASPAEVYVRGNVPGYRSVTSLLENDDVTLPEVVIKPQHDVAFLMYSSGTTGVPKGVMLTHYNIIANVCQFGQTDVDLGREGDVYLGLTPFFHVYGLTVILMTGLYLGVTIATLPGFTPDTYLATIQRYRVTLLHVAPPTALFLMTHPLVDRFDTSSVHTVFSGGAPLDDNVARNVKRRLKLRAFRQGYGMTEASPGILIGLSDNEEYGSVGVVMANTEVKVVDVPSSATLPANQRGEIWARGPQVMLGYHNNWKVTSLTVDAEGWLHTGDIGYYDKHGVFYIVDRIKELIKYKGFQVAPAEIEALLLRHRAVKDVAVVGYPQRTVGELPTAFVVKSEDVGKEELLNYVSERVAPYKRLRGGIIFCDVIPKSPSGKILRRVLRDKLTTMSRL